jgi:hypothetical protein
MRRNVLAAAVVGLLSLVAASSALADGTETLGPPSVTINANATRVVAAGVGMSGFTNTPNSFSVTVPAGATVRQVLLYWGGHFTSDVGAPDNAISVNGNAVVGTQIGGPAFFFTFMGDEFFTTYRTDITSLGLVSAGVSNLTISNMAFTSVQGAKANDGAGVLVLYTDPADPPGSSVAVRDGVDLAFSGFPAPRQSTVPQTFTFAPALVARTANLASMAGSVSGFEPEFGFRPNQLRITFGLGGTGDVTIDNPYQSNQGKEWDASNINVSVPAGASQMTVQALSGGPNPGGGTAVDASFSWNAAAVSIPALTPPPPPPPPPPAGEGCTPGYWKNHLDAWAPSGYSPNQALSTVLSPGGLGTLSSKTLLQALGFGGGSTLTAKKQILLRAAVASLLNAAHPDVDFGQTAAEVIAAVNAALASNNATTILALATKLDRANNAGCPLN